MFNFRKKEKKPENLSEVLRHIERLEKKLGEIEKELEAVKVKSNFSVQKVGIIRFNPFSGVGGDQSFSFAFLDGKNDGVVVTGLYTREGNRVYAKPVKNGASDYLLSEEEKKAIKKAIGSKNND